MDLSEYTVLEVGGYVAVPYAGKLLAGLGADVVKLEPLAGDDARRVGPFAGEHSAFFGSLNAGKRSVQLPRGDTPVRALVEALDVDLVVEDDLAACGVDPGALADSVAGLSVVSITGFGTTGPHRGYAAPEIVATAESGQMNKMGYPDRPPTRLRLKAAEYLGGMYGALAGLAALLASARNGLPGQHVDVSKREAGTSSLEFFLTGYSWSGETTERTGDGYPLQGDDDHAPTIYEAADGHVSVSASRFERFAEDVLERPELLEDERFESRAARRDHRTAVRDLVRGYTRERAKWDILEELQAAGLPSAVTATPDDILGFDHLEERGFWETVDLPNGESVRLPGFPFQVDGERPAQPRPPRLGEHTEAVLDAAGIDPETATSAATAGESTPTGETGVDAAETGPLPLDGIRVLDFTWVAAGPQTTKLLSALGADVVKVESERKPDMLRQIRRFDFDEESREVSAFWHEFNQGKRGIRLDLTSDRGRELALDLVAEADVVVENYSPGFMERVGLDHETIHAANPEAVYLSMPGWGNAGPARTFRSFGLNLQSMAGLDAISGFPEDPPTTSGQSWPDPAAGAMGGVAALAGLLHRELTGEGTYVELAQYEMTVSLLHKPLARRTLGEPVERTGNRDEDRRYVQGAYECAGEDRWAVVAVRTDEQWRALCDVVGRPELAADERFASQRARLEHHDAVDEVVEAWTRERSREEVRTRLQARGVPAGIVADERDLLDRDPQLRARDYFAEHDHPEVGTQSYTGVPFRMSRSPVEIPRRPPLFGEHTDEVLGEWLDLGAGEIARARDEGALF